MKNNYRVENDIVYIELNRKDGSKLYAMIDKDDLEIVDSYTGTWYANWSKCVKSFYCNIGVKNGDKWTKKALHRIIMDCPKDLQVDHIHHNPLDNRKDQLRIVTSQEQKFSKKISRLNKMYSYEQDARNAYLEAKAKYHIIEKR